MWVTTQSTTQHKGSVGEIHQRDVLQQVRLEFKQTDAVIDSLKDPSTLTDLG